jgi:hypothetical protein
LLSQFFLIVGKSSTLEDNDTENKLKADGSNIGV